MSLENLKIAVEMYGDKMTAHAIAQHPNESCGLISDYGFLPKPNTSDNPHTRFTLGEETYDSVREKYFKKSILGIFHSHTNGNEKPSPADRACCEQLGIPWAIYVLPQKTWIYMEPEGYIPPLIDRPWCYGVMDCYSIIRDAYRQIDIYLSDFVRAELYAWNTDPSWDMYTQNFEKEGFYAVNRPQPFDLIAMKAQSEHGKINHCGLYLGGNEFIHHRIEKVSERVEWSGYWRKSTVGFYRHKDIGAAWQTPIKLY